MQTDPSEWVKRKAAHSDRGHHMTDCHQAYINTESNKARAEKIGHKSELKSRFPCFKIECHQEYINTELN